MKELTTTIKGLITGLAMIAVGLVLYYQNISPSSPLQYIGYFIFGLGIVWSIFPFAKNPEMNKQFGKLFQQGFRCFVVVALLMTLFTIIFYKSNTKLIEEKAALAKQEYVRTEKNRTPQEIEEMVKSGKENFITVAASVTIFQYLLIGSIVSIATAGIIIVSDRK